MAGESPLLSVVVPFYGVEKFFADCLESLRRQTLKDIEFVLVDDGSYDGSFEIAAEYANLDSRFKIVRQDNAGLGPARNTGAVASEGRYLAFADSDDVIAPRAYELMVGHLEETGSDFAAGNVHRFVRKGWSSQSWTHATPFRSTALETHISRLPTLVGDRMAWNKVFRRDFWDHHGFQFPAIRYEDYPVTLKAHLLAHAVDVVHAPTYFWRQRATGDSITQQATTLGNMVDRITSDNMVLDLFADHNLPRVERGLYDHFIDVDLVVLGRGVAEIDDDTDQELLDSVQALAHRIEPLIRRGFSRADAVHRAMRDGQWSLIRDLYSPNQSTQAKALASADPRGLVKGVIAKTRAGYNKAIKQGHRKLRSSVTGISQIGTDTVEIRVKMQINRRARESAAPSAALIGEKGARCGLQIDRVADNHAADLRVLITPDIRRLMPDQGEGYRLEIGLAAGPIKWSGSPTFDKKHHPGRLGLGATELLQFSSSYDSQQFDHSLRILRLGDGFAWADFHLEGTTVVGRFDGQVEGRLEVCVPEGESHGYPVTNGEVEIDLVALDRNDPINNPVTAIAHRTVWIHHADGPARRVTLKHAPRDLPLDGQLWSLELNSAGQLDIVRRPLVDRRQTTANDPIYP